MVQIYWLSPILSVYAVLNLKNMSALLRDIFYVGGWYSTKAPLHQQPIFGVPLSGHATASARWGANAPQSKRSYRHGRESELPTQGSHLLMGYRASDCRSPVVLDFGDFVPATKKTTTVQNARSSGSYQTPNTDRFEQQHCSERPSGATTIELPNSCHDIASSYSSLGTG